MWVNASIVRFLVLSDWFQLFYESSTRSEPKTASKLFVD